MQGFVSCCAMQQGILSTPLPSLLHTGIAFLPSVLPLACSVIHSPSQPLLV